MLSTYLL